VLAYSLTEIVERVIDRVDQIAIGMTGRLELARSGNNASKKNLTRLM
jgi:hypothetical protein